MKQPEQPTVERSRSRGGLPWGMLFCVAIIAGVVTSVLRGGEEVVSWQTIGATLLMSLSLLVLGRWVQNSFWGLVLALVLPFQPVVNEAIYAEDGRWLLLSEGLRLAVLALLVSSLLYLSSKRCGITRWVFGGMCLFFATSLALTLRLPIGYFCVLLTGGWVVLALFLWIRLRLHEPELSVLNIVFGLLVMVGAAVGSVFASPLMTEWLSERVDLPAAAGAEHVLTWSTAAFSRPELLEWAWPMPWLVVLAMTWGCWRTVRRGWLRWRESLIPAAWLVTLYTTLVLVESTVVAAESRQRLLSLSSLAVLLTVYGVADFFRGIGGGLILQPPGEKSV